MGAYSQKGPAQSRTGRLPLNKVTAEASCHPTSPVSSHTAEIIPSILHARGQALPFENPPLNTQAPLGSLYSQKSSGELSQQSLSQPYAKVSAGTEPAKDSLPHWLAVVSAPQPSGSGIGNPRKMETCYLEGGNKQLWGPALCQAPEKRSLITSSQPPCVTGGELQVKVTPTLRAGFESSSTCL